MCGFAGFVDGRAGRTEDALRGVARAMADTLRHRGPDDGGDWADAAAGMALGHRRLSIIDLSPAGHQPMLSDGGRFAIAYNGEIYNHADLREELAGDFRGEFRGHSDTETLLAAWSTWGPERTLARLVGMFAFAIFDREERTLHLVRDRLGIKPLYWGRHGEVFLFGSELKALRAHPDFAAEVDRDALAGFLRLGYVPAPHSIYRGIRKLSPGEHLVLGQGREPEVRRYWDAREAALEGLDERFAAGEEDAATEALDAILRDAVARRLLSDVPLGAFLSGGVDSSTVVALMQAQSQRPVRTFSIGFRETGFDEAPHARAVASHLGTEHTELYVEPSDALAIVPKLPVWFDEPFSDSSQIPTHLVSALTRKYVTVALSGDGGDELFAGYVRYFRARELWRRLSLAPDGIQRGVAALLRGLAPAGDGLSSVLPAGLGPQKVGHRLRKLAEMLECSEPDALYRSLLSRWDGAERVVLGAGEKQGALFDEGNAGLLPDFVERMELIDVLTYLPDDILTKVDRASMAVALEARVPILDHRVVELSWRVPLSMKIRGGQGKWLLRQVLYRYVPRELIERPKMGFGVPIGAWLRGPLRDWAESLLAEDRLLREGFLDPAPVRRKWREHLSGRADWSYALWDVLMFQAWLEKNG